MPRPGFKKPRRVQIGRVGEEAVAWVQFYWGKITLMVFPENHMRGEEGPDIRLLLSFQSGGWKTVDMTAITEEELNKLTEFFALVREAVLPVIKKRDEVAEHAFSEGDGSFGRSYRTLPQLVVRERPPFYDAEGVHVGPQDATPGGGGERRPPVPGGDNDVLAEQHEGAGGPEDDSPKDNQRSDVQ